MIVTVIGWLSRSPTHSGLVAVCSDEVLELMAGEFPRKYEEYMDVVQEREFQAALKRKILDTKRVAQMHVGGCVANEEDGRWSYLDYWG